MAELNNAETTQQKRENLLKFYEFYTQCIEVKREDFESIKRQLEQILEDLLRQGKIGNGVKILSRIKAPASIVGKLLRRAGAHDIYGVTILTQLQEEIAEIEAAIKDIETTPKRRRTEKRGYEAVHFEFLLGKGKKKTKVECHMQSEKAYKSMYPHSFYKVRSELNRERTKEEERELTPEEEQQIIAETQRLYKSGELQGPLLKNGRRAGIPEMWEACFNEHGKMVERQLNDEEALKSTHYPCLEDIEKKVTVPADEEPDEDIR